MGDEPPKAAAHVEGVAALERGLAIVDALEGAARPLTLAEIAGVTRLYKSTLLRLLASLERCTLVVRRPDQRYALGTLAFRLGRAFEATYQIKEAVLPELEWLIAQGTESPSFYMRHDSAQRNCILRIDSHHSTLDRVRVGMLLPLDKGAPGHVITAFAALGAATPSMLVLASFGERDPLCAAVSGPVFGPAGELVGAMSLSGPLERFSPEATAKMKALIAAAAARATASLGGKWPVRPSDSSTGTSHE